MFNQLALFLNKIFKMRSKVSGLLVAMSPIAVALSQLLHRLARLGNMLPRDWPVTEGMVVCGYLRPV